MLNRTTRFDGKNTYQVFFLRLNPPRIAYAQDKLALRCLCAVSLTGGNSG